jgi:hypothetical protein
LNKKEMFVIGMLVLVCIVASTITIPPTYEKNSELEFKSIGELPEFILMVEPPTVPNSIMRYNIVNRNVTVDYVRSIGNKFGLVGYAEPANPGTLGIASDENGTQSQLMVYINSSSIFYITSNGMEYTPQTNLPNSEDARYTATNYLLNIGLLPADAFFEKVTANKVGIINKSTGLITDEKNISLQVHFSRRINDVPVFGPGAKLKVLVCNNSEISGVFMVWREINPCGNITIESPLQAYTKLKSGKALYEIPSNTTKAQIKEIVLGYWMEPADVLQDLVHVVYLFKGVAYNKFNTSIGNFTCYVPADSSTLFISGDLRPYEAQSQETTWLENCSPFILFFLAYILPTILVAAWFIKKRIKTGKNGTKWCLLGIVPVPVICVLSGITYTLYGYVMTWYQLVAEGEDPHAVKVPKVSPDTWHIWLAIYVPLITIMLFLTVLSAHRIRKLEKNSLGEDQRKKENIDTRKSDHS